MRDGAGLAGPARAWRARPGLLVIGALAFCAGVYLLPMLSLLGWAFRQDDGTPTTAYVVRLIGDEDYQTAFVTTFRTALVTTLVSAALGYPYAYLMATAGRRWRSVLLAAVMVPFWTSVLARSLAFVIILGRRGLVNDWLTGIGAIERPLTLLFNPLGVQIGMVHVLLPFMVLPIWAVLSRLDPALPRAARSLGASPARTFLEVVLPLSMPGLVAGSTLVFIFAIGFYITPALLGGPQDLTIATLIEMVVRDLLDWHFGAALSVALLGLVALVFAAGAFLAGAGRILGREAQA